MRRRFSDTWRRLLRVSSSNRRPSPRSTSRLPGRPSSGRGKATLLLNLPTGKRAPLPFRQRPTSPPCQNVVVTAFDLSEGLWAPRRKVRLDLGLSSVPQVWLLPSCQTFPTNAWVRVSYSRCPKIRRWPTIGRQARPRRNAARNPDIRSRHPPKRYTYRR